MAGVEVRKPGPFSGHAIQIRRLNLFLSVRSKISISQIIGHDENNVRRPVLTMLISRIFPRGISKYPLTGYCAKRQKRECEP